MRNVRIICEYDGTSYHGWQVQPNGISIQEVLEEKIGYNHTGKNKIDGLRKNGRRRSCHASGGKLQDKVDHRV